MTRTEKVCYSFVLAALLITLGSLGSAEYEQVTTSKRSGRVLQSRMSYSSGKKLLFVYIGAEDCAFSLKPGFDKTVQHVQHFVEKQARGKGIPFSSLGVSAGMSPELGVKYLSRFGPFDEVNSGRGLLNAAAIKYFFEELAGEVSLPQIVVVERNLAALDPGYTFSSDRVLVRAKGVPQIEQWAADSARVW